MLAFNTCSEVTNREYLVSMGLTLAAGVESEMKLFVIVLRNYLTALEIYLKIVRKEMDF